MLQNHNRTLRFHHDAMTIRLLLHVLSSLLSSHYYRTYEDHLAPALCNTILQHRVDDGNGHRPNIDTSGGRAIYEPRGGPSDEIVREVALLQGVVASSRITLPAAHLLPPPLFALSFACSIQSTS